MRIIWSSQAERELDQIWQFIAADNPDIADRIVERVYLASSALGDHPRLGRPGRSRHTRELVVSGTPYFLIYRTRRDDIEVLRVVHGARGWPRKSKRP